MSEYTPSKQKSGIKLFLIGLAVLAVAFALLFLVDGGPDEQAALQTLKGLGGITVLDASQRHVGTLNLQLVKGEAEIQRAMAEVSNLTQLEVLDASSTPLSDADLATVGALSKLNSLHLNDTKLTDAGLTRLVPLQQLYGLHVARTSVTDKGLLEIAKLRGLVHLDLSGNEIGPGLAELKDLPKLTWLLLQDVALEGSVLDSLGELNQIKRLTIGEADSRPELVENLSKRLPGVKID